MIRRFMVGWLAALLLVATSSPLAAEPEKCSWWLVGTTTTYFYDGTVYKTFHYEWICVHLNEA